MMELLFEDKYFGDLDRYNKVLVPHKRAFFKECQGLSSIFFELLSMFSFNLDPKTRNFRWGKRYYDTKYNTFRWITSNNGKVSTVIWDNESHQHKTIEINARFNEKILYDHFLGCYKPNRMANFYYKLNNEDKEYYKNYKDALINIYKIDGKTYGSSQKLNSDILLIDIDNYTGDKAIDKLRFFLNHCNLKVSDLLFIEQNALKGGIHCALKLPKTIKNSIIYKNLMEYFSKLDCKIECAFTNGILRFPLSYEYVALKHDEKILEADEYVPQELWEDTIEHYLNNLNWNPCNSDILNTFLNGQIIEVKENKYKDYWLKKRAIIKRVNENGPIKPKYKGFYKITAGNRYNTLSKLIPYCKLLGYDLNQTVDIIYSVNESSKDLAKWSRETLINNIKNFYYKCPFSIDNDFKSYDYIPNIDNIPVNVLNMLKDKNIQNHILNLFVKEYIKERQKHNEYFDHLSNEKIEILRKVLPIMIIEIIGKMYYELNNPKEFISDINEELGFQLPDCLLESIQKYSIKLTGIDSPIAKTSLHYLKKAIMKTLNLKEIQYKNRKRNWQLGSCKSFNIKSFNDLNNMLNHLYNSVYVNTIIKDFIIDKNKILSTIILSILLQQNQYFDILTGEIYDIFDKSPPD